jgi:hypothetical protein
MISTIKRITISVAKKARKFVIFYETWLDNKY